MSEKFCKQSLYGMLVISLQMDKKLEIHEYIKVRVMSTAVLAIALLYKDMGFHFNEIWKSLAISKNNTNSLCKTNNK